VHLDPGDETTLTGQLQINRDNNGNTIPAGDCRLGIWDAIPENPNAVNATGWLGYMASIPSGPGSQRLEVINPDYSDFNTRSFIEPGAGANHTAITAGPAPATGSPLDGSGTGTGTGHYFTLGFSAANGGANFQYNQLYNFSFRVARYGTGDNEVSVTISQVTLTGDYNDDGTVNAADYTVWRDHLGSTTYALPNRDPTIAPGTAIGAAEYTSWKNAFGGVKYTWNIGPVTDFLGVVPPATSGGQPVAVTDHTTFSFNRVGFYFGGRTHASQAQLNNVQFNKDMIQTLTLQVNTTTGAANIKSLLATPLAIDYYEISSDKGDLIKANWTGIDGTAASAPDGDVWDAAGGSSANFLAEGNLTSSLTLAPNAISPNLGNIFNPATLLTNRDLRFFIGLTDGAVIRGNVNYSSSLPGAGAGVPEPSGGALFLIGVLSAILLRRRIASDISASSLVAKQYMSLRLR
jgi:hypothetical protein